MSALRSVSLDYRRRSGLNDRWGAAVFALALVLAAWLLMYYRDLSFEVDAQRDTVARMERKLRHHPAVGRAAAEDTERLSMEIHYANDVLARLTLPWGKLFKAVESAGGEGIALLSIEPDPRKGEVKIGGEGKNIYSVLKYVRRLEASGPLMAVYLQNHQVQEQDPEKPVHFTVVATWTDK